MSLRQYFENTKGIGIIATSDHNGKVDVAIFSRPHILEDGSIAFIMRDRLTHRNLQYNPHAAYLFVEEGSYQGKRLFLTKIREEVESDLLHALKRRSVPSQEDSKKGPKILVIFQLDQELPLIGASE